MQHRLLQIGRRMGHALGAGFAALGQPWWSSMKLNADQIAERRRNREAIADQNFLWCWQSRGFW